MSATIELKPETARKLLELAESKGVSVDELLRALMLETPPASISNGGSASDRAQAFRAWASSHPKTTAILSDEAVSRRGIYHR